MRELFVILLFFTLVPFSFGQEKDLETQMQKQTIRNTFEKNGSNYIGDDKWDQTFNNISHPLAITGGAFVIGGAITYVVGSQNNNYQPDNSTQYIGIGLFAAGAVLFTVFSTERNENTPKRKKVKQKYDASDWEVE